MRTHLLTYYYFSHFVSIDLSHNGVSVNALWLYSWKPYGGLSASIIQKKLLIYLKKRIGSALHIWVF